MRDEKAQGFVCFWFEVRSFLFQFKWSICTVDTNRQERGNWGF